MLVKFFTKHLPPEWAVISVPWIFTGKSKREAMKNIIHLAALVAGSASVLAGDVTGTVTLKGTPPPEKAIAPLTADANCGKAAKGPVNTRHYVVGAASGLGNVFVYVKGGLDGKKFDAPASKAVIDQVACLYEPYVIGAQAGQAVEIRNSDPFLHNVNFMKSEAGNPTFNFAQGNAAKPVDKVFSNQEVFVKLQCNVHPWMFGYIGVVSNPYFAVTDKDGKFSLKGLPAGKYTLAFKHLKAGEVTQEVEVKDSGAEVKATLEVK
jgi:plastocyanin